MVGIGFTAALAKKNEREGRIHKIYAAMHEVDKTTLVSLEIGQGLDRESEEVVCKYVILHLLANTVDRGKLHDLIDKVPRVISYSVDEMPAGEFKPLHKGASYLGGFERKKELLIYPGSFNPVTEAHLEIAKLAEEVTGIRPIFEVSVSNFEKPPLDYFSLQERKFWIEREGYEVLFSNLPFFESKIKNYSECAKQLIFVVGFDAFERFFQYPRDPQFQPELEKKMLKCCLSHKVKILIMGKFQENNLSSDWDKIIIANTQTKNFYSDIRASDIRKGKV